MVQPSSAVQTQESGVLVVIVNRLRANFFVPPKGKAAGHCPVAEAGMSAPVLELGFQSHHCTTCFLLRNDCPRKMALEEFGTGQVHPVNVRSE